MRPQLKGHIKGALKTYRTIQFSMSSECLHPKSIFSNHRRTQVSVGVRSFLLVSGISGLAPHFGDKKSERPISSSTSAAQTLVKLRFLVYPNRTGCQQFLKTFFSRLLPQQREHNNKSAMGCNKYLKFFLPQFADKEIPKSMGNNLQKALIRNWI